MFRRNTWWERRWGMPQKYNLLFCVLHFNSSFWSIIKAFQRLKLFAHIFKINLLPKLSTHGHGAAPKLTLCSVVLPTTPYPRQSCNHSYFWHHQESLSPFLCSPMEGYEVSYSPWTEYFRGQQPGPGKPPELLVSTWQAATAALSGLLGERTRKDVSF